MHCVELQHYVVVCTVSRTVLSYYNTMSCLALCMHCVELQHYVVLSTVSRTVLSYNNTISWFALCHALC
jgi:hypothetical protein